MSKEIINIGLVPNDKTGDLLRNSDRNQDINYYDLMNKSREEIKKMYSSEN